MRKGWSTASARIGPLLGLAAVLGMLTACERSTPPERGWVRLGDRGFQVDGRDFFPVAVNYVATPFWIDGKCVFGPTESYASVDREHPRKTAARSEALAAHWALCRGMGFNTVRVVGISDLAYDSTDTWILGKSAWGNDTLVKLDPPHMESYLAGLEGLYDAARSAGLRVIPLIQLRAYNTNTERHFAQVADRAVNDTVIMAFDLFNEPLYFDPPERPKREVHGILTHWRELFDAHAPNHLYTLGLTGIRETFEFDPNMLQVDFVSFHPYEYEPDQVRNELYWYHHNVHVPWMIGETALPADDDSVSYADQAEFTRRTLQQTKACGAWGYSWWQFQDVEWGNFHQDHMGVLSREGTTRTSDGRTVAGTVKPMAQVIGSFDPARDAGPCICPPNQANYSEGRVCKVVGRLLDDRRSPIVNGTIIAWNEGWSSSYHTTSDSTGRFELRAPEWVHHWMCSATGHGMRRGECDPNGSRTAAGDSIPSFSIGWIELERLPFMAR